MVCAARSFGSSTPLWLGAAILGFALWWPLGLAVLLSFLWSRNMMCGHRMRHWRERGEEMRDDMVRRWRDERRDRPVTGNRAFDDYRAETLRRLEEERREFVEFLERLRRAKDQAEFDEFMAERTRRPSDPAQPA